MLVSNVIILARKHVVYSDVRNPSADLCLADAISLYDEGKFDYAKKRALKAIAYQVGILHEDYKKASK